MPARPERLPVAAGIDEYRRALPEGLPRILVRRAHRPVRADSESRQPRREVVGELVKPALGAEALVEARRKHEGVGDHGPAGMVPDQERWPRGDVLEAVDLAAKVRPEEGPDDREGST